MSALRKGLIVWAALFTSTFLLLSGTVSYIRLDWQWFGQTPFERGALCACAILLINVVKSLKSLERGQ